MTYIQILTQNYTLILVLNIFLSIIILSLERKNPTSALAWLFFMALLPGIGFMFYLLLSQNISKRKIFYYTLEESTTYNTLLEKQLIAFSQNKFQFNDPDLKQYSDMIIFHNRLSNSFYTQNNQIIIYTNGKKKFDALLEAIHNAKKHIHLQYYIVKNDNLSQKIFDACRLKAMEGVEVRFLIDSIGGRKIPRRAIKELEASGCEISFFFPSHIKIFNTKANYRNHRKIAVIDGEIGFIGGFNIGDEYLGYKKKFGKWRDTHLRIVGAAVMSLQIRFLLDWRTASKNEVENSSKYVNIPKISKGHAGIQIVDSGPDNINEQIKQGYLKMIYGAKKYIYIQTPYFVPDESIMDALKIAASSGVNVHIMFPNKPDHIFVYWATYSFIGELLNYGVKASIYDDGFIHTKTIVVDDLLASVGTCNFDIRSFKLNFEVNAFIYDKATTVKLRNIFEDDILVSKAFTKTIYAERSFIIKVKESISRLFSPVL